MLWIVLIIKFNLLQNRLNMQLKIKVQVHYKKMQHSKGFQMILSWTWLGPDGRFHVENMDSSREHQQNSE